jgi:hypothetical protein
VKLYFDVLLDTASSFSVFATKNVKKTSISLLVVASCTSTTQGVDFKTLPQSVTFPGKIYVKQKLSQKQM